MPRAKMLVRHQHDQPTFTLRGDGNYSYDVFVLGKGDTLTLPYTRRDGTCHAGPAVVTVQKGVCGISVTEHEVNDPVLWAWIAGLMQKGMDTLRTEGDQ
jgi:hypothetical protein